MDPRDCPTGRVATASDDVLDRRPMHQGPAARQRAQPSADSAVVYDLLADGESATLNLRHEQSPVIRVQDIPSRGREEMTPGLEEVAPGAPPATVEPGLGERRGVPEDIGALSAADLAALSIEKLSDEQLEQAYQTAQKVDAPDLAVQWQRAYGQNPSS